MPAWYKLRIYINSNPSPYIAKSKLLFLVVRNNLVFGIDKRPDFIALDVFAWKIA